MLGRNKLDNTLLTCDQGNSNQITAQTQNRSLVTVVRETCTNSATNTSLNEADMGAACRSKICVRKSCIEPLLFIDS